MRKTIVYKLPDWRDLLAEKIMTDPWYTIGVAMMCFFGWGIGMNSMGWPSMARLNFLLAALIVWLRLWAHDVYWPTRAYRVLSGDLKAYACVAPDEADEV